MKKQFTLIHFIVILMFLGVVVIEFSEVQDSINKEDIHLVGESLID